VQEPRLARLTFSASAAIARDANLDIVVMEVRDGKFAWTHDYHNHVTRAQAGGELPACLELIESMVLPEDQG
jgi:hypothetical protein